MMRGVPNAIGAHPGLGRTASALALVMVWAACSSPIERSATPDAPVTPAFSQPPSMDPERQTPHVADAPASTRPAESPVVCLISRTRMQTEQLTLGVDGSVQWLRWLRLELRDARRLQPQAAPLDALHALVHRVVRDPPHPDGRAEEEDPTVYRFALVTDGPLQTCQLDEQTLTAADRTMLQRVFAAGSVATRSELVAHCVAGDYGRRMGLDASASTDITALLATRGIAALAIDTVDPAIATACRAPEFAWRAPPTLPDECVVRAGTAYYLVRALRPAERK